MYQSLGTSLDLITHPCLLSFDKVTVASSAMLLLFQKVEHMCKSSSGVPHPLTPHKKTRFLSRNKLHPSKVSQHLCPAKCPHRSAPPRRVDTETTGVSAAGTKRANDLTAL